MQSKGFELEMSESSSLGRITHIQSIVMGIQQVRQKGIHFYLKFSRNICESKRTLTNDIGRSLMKDGGVSVCKQLDGVGYRHQLSFQSEGWNKYPVKPNFTPTSILTENSCVSRKGSTTQKTWGSRQINVNIVLQVIYGGFYFSFFHAYNSQIECEFYNPMYLLMSA